MNILSIECSTDLCLICLDVDGSLIFRQVQGVRSHSENILPFIADVLSEADLSYKHLTAIAVSAGPGSFTGVRLAASIAKTLAWVAQVPILSLSSLALNARDYLLENSCDNQSVCILRDAKMKEVYVAIYHLRGAVLTPVIHDSLIKLAELERFLALNVVSCEGNISIQSDLPVTALKEFASNIVSQTITVPTVTPLSLSSQARQCFQQGDLMSALDFDPVYLRGKGGWKTLKEQRADKKH